MQNHENKALAPDEIDLVNVFVKVIKYFSNNKKIFFGFNILAFIIATCYLLLKSNVYESKFIGECQSIPDSRVVDLIADLETDRSYRDWPTLAKKLNMRETDVKKIKKIEALPNITIEQEAKNLADYSLPGAEISHKFGIIVKVKDNGILPQLQKGIINYLTVNEYSKLRVDRFLENRKSLLIYLNQQIRKLDSLNLLFATKIVSSSYSSTLTSPGDYKGLLVSLQEKALSVEDQIKFCQPVMIIKPFIPFKEPVEPVIPLIYLISLMFFNFVAVLYTAIKKLKETYSLNKDKY
jgi:hypothetical protein